MRDDIGDRTLVQQIQAGDERAWSVLISRFEGRLFAFLDSRIRNCTTAEDLVQETFCGFLLSLPNYDTRTPLESFLFAIASHKLTDWLRRQGRRPVLGFDESDESGQGIPGRYRHASSLVRSREGRGIKEEVLSQALAELIKDWQVRGDWERLMVFELIVVCGMSNKLVAETLGISEQSVANHKFAAVSKLKDAAKRAGVTEDQWSLLNDSWGNSS